MIKNPLQKRHNTRASDCIATAIRILSKPVAETQTETLQQLRSVYTKIKNLEISKQEQ